MKLAAVFLLAVAGFAHAQPFVFASQEQARAVLGARDDYVRATAALERSVKLRTPEAIEAERYAEAMAGTALGWKAEEQTALAPVLASLQRFISAMRWKSPRCARSSTLRSASGPAPPSTCRRRSPAFA